MTLLKKIVAGFIIACLLFGAGAITGWYMRTPKVTQGDLNKEADIGKQYAEKRAADKAKGDEQKRKAAASSNKVVYRNCALDDEDFNNLKEAFKR